MSVASISGQTSNKLLDVKTFGAVGDGVTDDTAALQAATATAARDGKELHFGPGAYAISRPLQLFTNSDWEADPGTVTLVATARNTLLEAVLVQNVTIDGFTLSGGTAAGAASPLMIAYRSGGVVFTNDTFEHTAGIGALFSDVNGSSVVGSTFTDIGNSPADLSQSAQAVAFCNDLAGYGAGNAVMNSTFSQIGLDAISAVDQVDFKAASNTMPDLGMASWWSTSPAAPAGFYGSHDEGLIVEENSISQANGNGIDIDNSGRVLIKNNTISKSGSAGIALSSTSGATIYGNTTTDNDQLHHFLFRGGISIGDFSGFRNSSNILIKDNFSGNSNGFYTQPFGIQITEPSHITNIVVSTDNSLLNNSSEALSISSEVNIVRETLSVEQALPMLLTDVFPRPNVSLIAPVIQGLGQAALGTSDTQPTGPFGHVEITAKDSTGSYTATVTLSDPGNGILTALPLASYDNLTGTLTVVGSAATVSQTLRSVMFVPTVGQVAPGASITTALRIAVDNGSGAPATGSVQVTATSNKLLDVKTFGAVGDGVTDDTAALQAATATAARDGKELHFGPGAYAISRPLQLFTNSDWEADPGTVTLVATARNTLLEAVLVQNVTIDGFTLSGGTAAGAASPLMIAYRSGGVVFTNDTFEHTAGIGALFSDVNGSSVVGSTFTDIGNSPADLSQSAQAVAFCNDLAGYGAGNAVMNSTFSQIGLEALTATGQSGFVDQGSNVFEAPVIQGLGQAALGTSDTQPTGPFGHVEITAKDSTGSYTATVTLSDPGNGILTALPLASYDNLTGTLTVVGSAATVSQTLRSVMFVPTVGQVAPGASITTALRIAVDNGSGAPATGSVQVTATSNKLLDVKTFGAVGDGVTDDTAALQAATATAARDGKELHFGPGAYAISRPLQLFTNSDWEADPGTVTLVATARNTLLEAVLVQNVTIDGFTLSGGTAAGAASPLMIAYRSGGVVFTNDTFEHTAGIGALFSDVNGSSVVGSTFTDIGNSPADLSQSAQAVAFCNDLAGYGAGNAVMNSTFSQIGLEALTATGQSGFVDQGSNVFEAPVIQGLGQAALGTSDTQPTGPFGHVEITAKDSTGSYTATVTLSDPGNGILTALPLASYDNLTGTLTVVGSAATVSQTLRSVMFVPTVGQVAPGASITTALRIAVDNGSGAPATGSVQVTATSNKLLDVKTFGAVGDGVTDDTAALQAATATAARDGKELHFGPGAYAISRPLQLFTNSDWEADPGTVTLVATARNTLLGTNVPHLTFEDFGFLVLGKNNFAIEDSFGKMHNIDGGGQNDTFASAFITSSPPHPLDFYMR